MLRENCNYLTYIHFEYIYTSNLFIWICDIYTKSRIDSFQIRSYWILSNMYIELCRMKKMISSRQSFLRQETLNSRYNHRFKDLFRFKWRVRNYDLLWQNYISSTTKRSMTVIGEGPHFSFEFGTQYKKWNVI